MMQKLVLAYFAKAKNAANPNENKSRLGWNSYFVLKKDEIISTSVNGLCCELLLVSFISQEGFALITNVSKRKTWCRAFSQFWLSTSSCFRVLFWFFVVLSIKMKESGSVHPQLVFTKSINMMILFWEDTQSSYIFYCTVTSVKRLSDFLLNTG